MRDQWPKGVLVTGGTGRQGRAVARLLLARQVPVTVLTRDTETQAARALAAEGARLMQGDFEKTRNP